jgi:hypothetical protein
MGTIPFVFMTMVLCGGGWAYCGCSRHRGAGVGGAFGSALLIFLVFWLIGGVHFDSL